MGMYAEPTEQAEQLSPEARKGLNDAMVNIVWDISKASTAVVALSEMMQEHGENRDWSRKASHNVEHGMWLCQALGSHQQALLERLEIALRRSEFVKGPESLLADCPSFNDSLSVSARSVAPARI